MYIKQNRQAYLGVLIILSFIAKVHTRPALWSEDKIIFSENQPWDGHQYHFSYKTKLGSSQSETGQIRTSPAGNPYIGIQGQYITPTNNGGLKTVFYEANNEGFKIVKQEEIKPVLLEGRLPDLDAIFFPTDKTPVQESTITAVKAPEEAEVDNTLDNRVSNLPPAVVASLLG